MLQKRWFRRSSRMPYAGSAFSSRRRLMRRQPALAACVEALESRLVLSTLIVTTGMDVVSDGDGLLSLREAVLIANDSTGATAFDGFSSTDFADLVVFSDDVFGAGLLSTVQLAGTQLPQVGESLTIDGAVDAGAARITIDAAGQSRILEIGSAATLRLENVILTRGSSGLGNGGALRNAGVLEVIDTDVTASTSSASGAAISNDGTLSIVGGAMTGNSAGGSGGGVFNDGGTATIAGTRIEDNTAAVQGGGIFNSGAMTITDAVIEGNRAESESPFVPSPLTVGNILINNDPYGPASLIEYTVDGTLVRTLPLSIGQDIALDAQGRVQVYAAPDLITYDPATQNETTLTVPGWSSAGVLTYGGLAAFGPFVFGTDQETAYDGAPRGVVRIDTRDGSWIRFGDVDCFDLNVGLDGLLYVLSQGNAPSVGGTRITVFDPLTMVKLGTIELPVVVRAIAVDSAGEIFTAGTSGPQHFIQHFDAAGNLLKTLSTEVGGLADIDIRRDEQYLLIVSHGGEFVVTTPALDSQAAFNSGVSDNVAFGTFIQPPVGVTAQSQGAGGGIFNAAGAGLTMTGGELTGNFALLAGGGLQNDGGTLALTGVVIDSNTTDGDGAGLHNSGAASVEAAAVAITNNTAAGDGGGLWTSSSGTFSLLAATIADNSAQSGAGLFAGPGSGMLNVTASTISANTSVGTGGGLHIQGGAATLANSTVSGNHAGTGGGGIRADAGTLTLLSATVAANHAAVDGGGVDEQGAAITAQSTIIATNTAGSSGPNFRGTLQSDGFNLIGNTSEAIIAGLAVTDLTDIDAQLDGLKDNGGQTKTHALLQGSPAIDVGFNATGAVFDQRGAPFTRSFAGATDIGAFEFHLGLDLFAVGAGPGGGPAVRLFDAATGQMLRSFFAFHPAFRGGITIATGDVSGDGFPDIIVGAGPGGGPAVRIFDGQTGAQIGEQIFAFPLGFRGGVTVATGDLDGDGDDEILVGAGPGGGPAVRIFDGQTGAQIGEQIFAFPPAFRGGVTVAAGDLDGDGDDEILVGAGPGGGPAVRVFDGATRTQVGKQILAFPRAFRGGVVVSATDVNGDGATEILAGAGPGGDPALRVFDGSTGQPVGDPLFPFNRRFRGGIVVAGYTGGAENLGAGLRVDGSQASAVGLASDLAQSDLAPLIAAARSRLQWAGVSEEILARLASIDFVIADLGDDRLGLARPGRMLLDDDAAGYGWFVDYSPLLDEEFFDDGSQLVALDARASGRIDLLTAVLHEMGHALGLDHVHWAADHEALMSATLPAGVRRLFEAEDLDSLFADDDLLDPAAV